MSAPTTADLALIEIKTAGVFMTLCGLEGVQVNRSSQLSERYVRDFDRPNRPGVRRMRVNGQAFTITGSGLDNTDQEVERTAAFGGRREYVISLFRDDGSAQGALLGRYLYRGLIASQSQSFGEEATAEVTLEGEGTLQWVAAGGSQAGLVANETTLVI